MEIKYCELQMMLWHAIPQSNINGFTEIQFTFRIQQKSPHRRWPLWGIKRVKVTVLLSFWWWIRSDWFGHRQGLWWIAAWELSWAFFWRVQYLGVTCQRCLQTLETLLRRKREIFTTIIMIIMPRQRHFFERVHRRHHYQLTRSPLNIPTALPSPQNEEPEEVMLSLCFSSQSHCVLFLLEYKLP